MTTATPEALFAPATVLLYLALFSVTRVNGWLRPVRLMSVYFHEVSHACAALLLRRRLVSLTVRDDGSGETRWAAGSGGSRCANAIVYSAGYVGSALWASALLLASALRSGIVAGGSLFFVVSLVGAGVGYASPSSGRSFVASALASSAVTALAALACLLRLPLGESAGSAVLLLYGSGLLHCSLADAAAGVVAQQDDASDASRCAAAVLPCRTGCCAPRCVGAAMLSSSAACAAAAVYGHARLAEAGRTSTEAHRERIAFAAALACLLLAAAYGRRLCRRRAEAAPERSAPPPPNAAAGVPPVGQIIGPAGNA